MSQEVVKTISHAAVLVEDATTIQMVGFSVIEALPPPRAPYELTDPFILVQEGRFRLLDVAAWTRAILTVGSTTCFAVLKGPVSTGHSTGPGGSTERARLPEGSLLWLRMGQGAWDAECIGADEIDEGKGDTEFRSVLFWVNLACKKEVEPRAIMLHAEKVPLREATDATVHVLVGEGSPVEIGTAASILDVELPEGGVTTLTVSMEFQGFEYLLEGEESLGATRPRANVSQLVLLGPCDELSAHDSC